MPRVKRGKIATKKRKKVLKYTKGFMWGRKSKERLAKEALLHAWSNMFKHRKLKKRDFRKLWQIKIKAIIESMGLKYNQFVKILKDNNVILDRKILSQLAEENPYIFKQIVEKFKK